MSVTKEFKELARHAARRTAPANYNVSNVDEAFRKELQSYCGSTIAEFMKNRWDLYAIIMENADEVVPAKVLSALGIFAEIREVPQGTRQMFRTSKLNSKLRARKFLTQVGLAGVYESFRLDSDTYEVKAHAIGGAVSIDFERMLDGHESMAEVMDIIAEGQVDAVFMEVQKALRSLTTSADIPNANVVNTNVFDGDAMFKLCSIAKSYGGNGIGSNGAIIFAPPEFIAAMGPDAIVPVATIMTGEAGSESVAGITAGVYHPNDIDMIHRTGYINLFRGTPIVQIPQSFTDTTNTKTYVDPRNAYILPTGGEKAVKVVFEGKTQMYDWVNKDNSMEMQVYRKLGVAIHTFHNICVYRNTAITDTFDASLYGA